MKNSANRLALAALFIALCVLAPQGRAETGITNIVNGVTNIVAGDFMVGTNGSFNTLIVTNAGVLAVYWGSGSVIGYSVGSVSNTAWVTGAGSLWSNQWGVSVGYRGSDNRLVITNGGRVLSGEGLIGYEIGKNNAVLVSGMGSLWSNSGSLRVGSFSSGNRLTIADGGQMVTMGNSEIGDWYSASGNAVLVTDPGSRWVSSTIIVGNYGPGNNLTVSNGGQVLSAADAWIGAWGGASGNSVLVADPGSLWSNAGNLWLTYGGGGSLTIANSGRVLDASGYVGYGSRNQSVLVTGTGSLWANTNSLYVGLDGANNSLTIADGAHVLSTTGFVGKGDDNNRVLVTGAGSMWSNASSLYIGEYSYSNHLTVANGGSVFSADAYIGGTPSGNPGQQSWVLVSDAGSLWSNAGNLHVGYYGSGNQLVVSNGAHVVNSKGYVSSDLSGSNQVVITGADSLWLNTSDVLVDHRGQLITADNGTARAVVNLTVGTEGVLSNAAHVIAPSLVNNGSVVVSGGAATLTSVTNFGTVIQSGGEHDSFRVVNKGAWTISGGVANLTNFVNEANASLTLSGGVLNATVSLQNNSWLRGTGTINGSVTSSGGIAPGFSAGDLDINGNVTLLSVAELLMEIAGADPSLYDQIYVADGLVFGGALTVSFLNGYTPQAGDRFDLFDFSNASGAFSDTNLPALSSTLYWNTDSLYSRGEISVRATAEIISPTDGSTFTSSLVTFTWSPGTGVGQHAMWVGNAPRTYDLYAGMEPGLSRTLALPTDGRRIYVTLWSWVNGGWQGNDYDYTAAIPAKAQMLSPTPGTTLTSGTVNFSWDSGVVVSLYALWVGSTPSSHDLYAGVERGLSRTLNLPTDGRTLHVTLWSLINGAWQSNAYTYTAYDAPVAQMGSPTPGTTLTGDRVTFNWAGVPGATLYALWVGSSPGAYDLYAASLTGLSRTVNVPTDGRTLHVTLWSYVNGQWRSNAYTYTAPTAAKAQMLLPLDGGTLTGAATTFLWDAGVGVTQYALWVGNAPSSYDLYAGVETGLSHVVNLPTDGRTLYVTLWSLINGVWQSNAYTYTAHTPIARMLSPAPGTTLTGDRVTFEWSAVPGAWCYLLWVGSSPNGFDLYSVLETGQSSTVKVPTDGRPLYVTLWSRFNGVWRTESYVYTAYTATAPEKAVLSNPAGGTTLTGDRATFEWSSGAGVTSYDLWVGSTAGNFDVYASRGTSLSQVANLPTDGSTLYVTLRSFIQGVWQTDARTYTAYTAIGMEKATMRTPAPGSTLTGAVTKFDWNSGVGATRYVLWVGTTPNSYDLYAGMEDGLSRILVLPTDGRTLYVRLFSWINGAWQWNDYTYTAFTAP